MKVIAQCWQCREPFFREKGTPCNACPRCEFDAHDEVGQAVAVLQGRDPGDESDGE